MSPARREGRPGLVPARPCPALRCPGSRRSGPWGASHLLPSLSLPRGAKAPEQLLLGSRGCQISWGKAPGPAAGWPPSCASVSLLGGRFGPALSLPKRLAKSPKRDSPTCVHFRITYEKCRVQGSAPGPPMGTLPGIMRQGVPGCPWRANACPRRFLGPGWEAGEVSEPCL